jgi:predicted AlkP superfamily pyrophosphatase or phosphodiesterase
MVLRVPTTGGRRQRVAATAAILLLAICVGAPSATPAPAADPASPPARQSNRLGELAPLDTGGHVIIVIIDGLRPDLISAQISPTLTRLIDEGTSTLEAQTVRPTITLPAITSILTGIRPRDHGVTWNDYEPEKGVVAATTIFHIAKEAGLGTAFFSGKVKLRHAAPPEALDRFSVRFLPDVSVIVMGREHLTEALPGLMVLHLPNIDRAGHLHGWGSEQQREMLRTTDIAIASLIDTIETTEGLGPTRVIVTADHGGEGKSHQRASRRSSTVPWVIWGNGVEPAELDSMEIVATAAVALRSLGLEVPGHMVDVGSD